MRWDPRRVDYVVAAVAVALSLIQIWFGGGAGDHPWRGTIEAVPVCLCVATRRRWPLTSGLTAQGVTVLGTLTSHVLTAGAWTVAWFCALYGIAVWATPVRFAVGTTLVAVSDLVPSQTIKTDAAVPFAVGTAVVMVLLHRVVGDRDRRARLAARERNVAAREAVVHERARIARELHDAVAHNVSVMVLQAGAERRTLDPNAASAQETLETIERTGREALTEMRRMVGMLRDDQGDPLAPLPRLADLPMLVNQVREAGLNVQLRMGGDPRELPAGIEVSAYRVVQEALTNILKHANDTTARVRVNYGPKTLALEIEDDGGGRTDAAVPGGGHGLVGMQERVALYGGDFTAGPQTGGGFAVRVRLPLS